MDGNHRWARQQKVSASTGHRQGARNVRIVAEACADEGVRYLTLFAFSTENWNRPRREIELLFDLIAATIERDLEVLHERDARIVFIGDRTRFPSELQTQMHDSEEQTRNNASLDLIVALSYGGRWDLLKAAKTLARQVQSDEIELDNVDQQQFQSFLSCSDIPDPDLCVRTGGDQRLSNFLLWDLAYTELYFTPTYWPDFSHADLKAAFCDFSQRHRRYGSRSLQINQNRAKN